MKTHWTQQPEMRKAFHMAAVQVMIKTGLLPGTPEMMRQPWNDQAYKSEMDRFKVGCDLSEKPTIADAIETLKNYCALNHPGAEHASDIARITCEVTRHYGDISLKYGITADYKIVHQGMVTSAFNELREIVEAQHDLAAENRPALMPAANGVGQTESFVEVMCTHVRKEFVDGKERLRLIGGEYTKFGIAVYEEFMQVLGIKPETLPMGDTPYGHKVKVQLDHKGQPKRAIERV